MSKIQPKNQENVSKEPGKCELLSKEKTINSEAYVHVVSSDGRMNPKGNINPRHDQTGKGNGRPRLKG